MNTFMEFVKKHLKKFIIGGILIIITLGGSLIYTIFKNRGGES